VRVWVSGARGRLGTEVGRQLTAAGHEVLAADIRGEPSVDLLDPSAVEESMRGAEAIVHCAGIPGPEGVTPLELVRTNTLTTLNALETAWSGGVPTAVLASSGSIYGTAWSPEELSWPALPVDEDSELRYLDPYALTKDFLERMGAMYARRGMTVTALRFHWILTPDEVRSLVDAAPIESGRRNLWGYVDLEDAARACLLALTPRDRSQRFHTLLIAADDTGVTRPTSDLLDEFYPDAQRRTPFEGSTGLFDCARAAKVIGWVPRSRWRQ
jgi:nucleoside-diphosphate-sugar epimerase